VLSGKKLKILIFLKNIVSWPVVQSTNWYRFYSLLTWGVPFLGNRVAVNPEHQSREIDTCVSE
jgi:hypothetical protein